MGYDGSNRRHADPHSQCGDGQAPIGRHSVVQPEGRGRHRAEELGYVRNFKVITDDKQGVVAGLPQVR